MSVAAIDPPDRPEPREPRSAPGDSWAVPGLGRSWQDADGEERRPGVEVPAVLADAVAVVRALRGSAPEAVTAGERAGWLVGLRELVDAAEVTFTDVLGRFDAHGDAHTLTGAASTSSWLGRELRLAGGDAASRVAAARNTDPLTRPLDAAARGDLRFEHVRAISKALRPLTTTERPPAVDLLTELASSTTPAAIAVAGRRIRDTVDPDGSLTAAERQHDRRYLALSPLLDGMTAVDGLLDPEATATLYAALAPLMVPTGRDDTRTTDQRRADALADIAVLALRTGDLPVLSGTAAALDVLVDHATLERLHRRARGARHGGHPSSPAGDTAIGADSRPAAHDCAGCRRDDIHTGAPSWLRPGGATVLTGGDRTLWLADHVLDRLACDSSIGRIVFGPGSVPIDLGRRARTFTRAQRRALTARDQGCRHPGCPRPPRFTDAHHLQHWENGGTTDLRNGLLLCRYHHNATHHPTRPWTITVDDPQLGTNGRLTFTGPDGLTLTSDPRGP